MFNFQNLNPTEFEVLSKDILEIETGKKFRTFTSGRDGGIDIGLYETNDEFAQVKHTIKSTFPVIMTNLKKELVKVKKKAPKEYYLFISKELTPANIKEIYELFSDYMVSSENIYDGTKIDDLLQSDKYSDVVHKHYKLWLVSTGVLEKTLNNNIFIDTEVLFDEIEDDLKLFVDTQAYYDSLEILEENHVLIIQGNPGVGKTTISKMLLLEYASKGFNVRYASSNSIRDIKNSLSKSQEVEEIVLLDDFLGQHYLNITEERPNEIKTLISYINKHPKKRLILNTRVTILNEAERKFQDFNTYMSKKEIDKYIIDIDKMPLTEKAKIFYNHLYFNHIPQEYFNEILIEKRYMNIISHKNYNPRIVEFISNKHNYEPVIVENYYKYIENNLNNPHRIWEEEFEERIEDIDRIFMYCLYSISNSEIGILTLKEIFNHFIRDERFDNTADLFNKSLIRLTDSMIKIIVKDNLTYITVINPSVNDYLFNKIQSNNLILENIVSHSIYHEQLNILSNTNKLYMDNYFIKIILAKTFNLLRTLIYNISFYLLNDINRLSILDKNLTNMVHEALTDTETYHMISSRHPNNWGLSNNIFGFIMNELFYEIYSLHEILFNLDAMRQIISIASDENILKLNQYYEKLIDANLINSEIWQAYILDYQEIISSRLSEVFYNDFYYEYHDNMDEIINAYADDIHIEELHNSLDEIIDYIEELILDETQPTIKEKSVKLHCGYLDLKINVNIDVLIKELELKNEVESYYESRLDSYNDGPDYEGSYHSLKHNLGETSDNSEIDAMFHREYDN